MPLRTTLRRLRSLESIVAQTARRDLQRRRVRRLDAAVAAPGMIESVQFDAPALHRSRELPARTVPLRSPREHSQELIEQVQALLHGAGIPTADFLVHTAADRTLGIRAEHWSRATELIAKNLDQVLVGTGARRAGTALYSPHPDEEDVERSPIIYVLAPAVSRHRGRVVKRYGFETALRLHRWNYDAETGGYTAARWNPRAVQLSASAFRTTPLPPLGHGEPSSPAPVAGPAHIAGEDPLDPLAQTPLMAVDFPIDVVYTWVDGTDPQWIARKRAAAEQNTGERMSEAAAADLRFVAHDELRHSLRSLEQYAPWVRHIYLVTDRQRPEWLREDHPRITVVDHTEIAPEGSLLPSFNSQAIEANLHRIEGLSEHFIYFNDDVFLSSPIAPDLFFHPNGIASMYLSKAHVGPGEPIQAEPASDSAGKNARALVREVSGRRVSRKLFHTPFALQRSVSQEIEHRWPEVVQATRDSQFRRIDDITLSGALHMNYAYATGRAVTHSIRYRYLNVGSAGAAKKLRRLHKDRDVLQTFCLNEATQELPPEVIDQQVRDFLAHRFPDVSSFEKLDAAV